jgi:PAS domain S-box-containing protein
MRVQTKLLLTVTALAAALGVVLGAVILQQARTARLLAAGRNTQLAGVVHPYLDDVDGALSQAIAEDYSRWDEMVAFVQSEGRDTEWSDAEVPPALETFRLEAIWVYSRDLRLLWSCNDPVRFPDTGPPAGADDLRAAFATGATGRFWVWTTDGIMEVRWAGVVPSGDRERLTEPVGYFLAGRLYDHVTLERIGQTLGGRARIWPATAATAAPAAAEPDGDDFVASDLLPGPDGSAVAVREVRIPAPQVEEALVTAKRFIAVGGVMGLLLIALTAWCLARWVGSPLRALSDSLAIGDAEAIGPYLSDPAEMGDIARMVQASFQHTAALNEEIEERRRTEAELAVSEGKLSLKARISEVFLTADDDTEMCRGVLGIILQAVESRDGIMGYLDNDGNLVCPALTPSAEASRAVFVAATWPTMWSEVLRTGLSAYTAEETRVPGLDVPLSNALAVPIRHGSRLVGLFIVANRPGGYGDEQRFVLEELAAEVAPVYAARLDRAWAEGRRSEAQRELELQREQLQTVIHSLPVGILLVDVETHRIVDANTTACDLIGAPAEVLAGAVCHEFVCPASVGACPVTDLGHTVDRSERELIRFDKSRVPIMKSVVEVGIGDRRYLLESFIDITELKETQNALERSELEAQELAHQLQTENDRMRRELERAAEVQRKTLPERCVARGLRIAHHFHPSGRIGGDFFGVIQGEGGASITYVGDVSGHGLASALVVNLIVGIMEEVIDPDTTSPAEALATLQARLCTRLEAVGHYATLLLCRYAGVGRQVEYANAGHPWPLIAGDGACAVIDGDSGLPLGWLADERYDDQCVTLGRDELLLLYSDGLTEARVAGSPERIGTEIVTDWLRSLGSTEPEQVTTTVASRAGALAGGVFEDDLTLLAFRLALGDEGEDG